MKLLATAGDLDATITRIRLHAPLNALQLTQPGLLLRWRAFHACADEDLSWADVLVVQRGLDARALGLIQRMRAGGGRVVFEIDDLLTEPAPTLQAHDELLRAQPWLRRGLAEADVVSVSTERLGQHLAPLARRWRLTPNHGAVVPQRATAARQGAWPTLLLASSDQVVLGPLSEALTALAADEPLRIVAVGPVAQDLARAGVAVQAEAPRPREAFLAWVASLPDPVALVPLGHTPFDACKSAIKYFDLALLGVPVVASLRPPYSDVIDSGVHGLLVPDSAAAWADAVRALRRDAALGPRLAAAAREQVQSRYLLAHSAMAWAALLGSLPERGQPAPRPAIWKRWADELLLRLRQANRRRLRKRQRAADDGHG